MLGIVVFFMVIIALAIVGVVTGGSQRKFRKEAEEVAEREKNYRLREANYKSIKCSEIMAKREAYKERLEKENANTIAYYTEKPYMYPLPHKAGELGVFNFTRHDIVKEMAKYDKDHEKEYRDAGIVMWHC